MDETDMEEIRARLLAVVLEVARGRDDGDNGKHDGKQRGLRVVRAVLPVGSSLVGKTAGDAEFRTKYLSAIVAISRSGTNPQGALKDVRFLPRYVLVLQVTQAYIAMDHMCHLYKGRALPAAGRARPPGSSH